MTNLMKRICNGETVYASEYLRAYNGTDITVVFHDQSDDEFFSIFRISNGDQVYFDYSGLGPCIILSDRNLTADDLTWFEDDAEWIKYSDGSEIKWGREL